MNVITLEQARERLEEARSRIADIEENTGRYCELGEWRIEGYENEAYHEELKDFEERILKKIAELEEAENDERH